MTTRPSPEHRIGKDAYVVLDYVLYDEDGDVLEATDDEGGRPIGFVWGYGTLVPGRERAIQGMAAGETRDVEVAPDDAYGQHDPDLERWVDRSDLPDDLALDDELVGEDAAGEELTLRVVEIEGDAVLLDANHPLAGEPLRFDVMVRAVRPATPAEIADARAHAPKPRLSVLSGAPEPEPEPEPAPAPEPPSREPRARAKDTHPGRKAVRRGKEPELPAELEDEQ